MKKVSTSTIVSLSFALVLSACATDEFGNRRPLTDTEKGAMIGAATGALLGAVVKKDKKKKGILIGAVGGGIAGGLVGHYMDNQKKDLEKLLAPEQSAGAIQIEKLPDNALRVTMTSQTAFAVNSSEINSAFRSTMDKIGVVLKRYGKTVLTIAGHTDSTGSEQYNQSLSNQRARAVHQYFAQQGVIPQRLESFGKGESEPRASNASAQGRQLNRRVEIFIVPIVEES